MTIALSGRASAGSPSRLSLLIWNDQTALAQAKPEPPAETPSRPRRVIKRFLSWGRIQRSARSCQRGAVLSDGESWGAGRGMVFQHPSASAGFPEGIEFDGPLVSSPVAPKLPQEPRPSPRPIDPRLASRQRRARPAPTAKPSGRCLSHLRNQVVVSWHGR